MGRELCNALPNNGQPIEQGRCPVRREQSDKHKHISRQPTAPQPVLELPLIAPRADEEIGRRKETPKIERGVAVVDFYI